MPLIYPKVVITFCLPEKVDDLLHRGIFLIQAGLPERVQNVYVGTDGWIDFQIETAEVVLLFVC